MTSTSTRRVLPQWIRSLHIWLSMIGFGATLLFAVTGFTLNHREWFERDEPVVTTARGTLPDVASAAAVDRLEVAEALVVGFGWSGPQLEPPTARGAAPADRQRAEYRRKARAAAPADLGGVTDGRAVAARVWIAVHGAIACTRRRAQEEPGKSGRLGRLLCWGRRLSAAASLEAATTSTPLSHP